MITIKCNEKEKEMFEILFWKMSKDGFDCNGLDLSCDCCPAPCGDNKFEVEYEVENSDSEVNTDKLVYISGAITGIHNYLDLFKQAESELKELGYQTINPAEILSHLPKTTPYEVYMNMSYEMLSTCDYIYTMDGGEDSKGAKLELEYAKEHGIEILKIETYTDLDRKNYTFDQLECFHGKTTIHIAPNLEKYSQDDSTPIYLKVDRERNSRYVDTVDTGLSVGSAKLLHDSLGEILDTIEKKNK